MTFNAAKLLADALHLSEQERAEIAARLIESLDREVDDDAAEQWAKEIERRVSELESGAVKPVPWPEARKRIVGGSNGESQS